MEPTDFQNAADIFAKMQDTIDPLINDLFSYTEIIFSYFYLPVAFAAIIFVALTGYAMMSGYIIMSGRETAVRLSKVVLALVVMHVFAEEAGDAYDLIWEVPGSLADMFASVVSNGTAVTGGGGTTSFGLLISEHTQMATNIAYEFHKAGQDQTSVMVLSWMICMAPLAVILLVYALAKIISAALFLLAPIVLILSLTSVQTPYIMAWVKAVLVTLLTVVLLFFLGSVVLELISVELISLFASLEPPGKIITLPDFYLTGVLSILGVVIIGQSTSIASSVIGSAAVNTQQGTSLMQIGALQAGSKAI